MNYDYKVDMMLTYSKVKKLRIFAFILKHLQLDLGGYETRVEIKPDSNLTQTRLKLDSDLTQT